jgi:hypothetical protein
LAQKVLECEAALPLTALIGLNIIIGGSFDSTDAAIAMNFVRATGVQGKRIASTLLAAWAVELPTNGRQQ